MPYRTLVSQHLSKLLSILSHPARIRIIAELRDGDVFGKLKLSRFIDSVRDVDWGELDYLIVDMPPGTGDAQLTLTTATQISGVLVTTPQDVALLDGRRGFAMFEKMHVPVLGLIENRSYFSCPECHANTHIFGTAGGRALANEMQMPLLGEIPIDVAVREGGDAGRPITAFNPEHPIAQAYIAAAKQVAAQVSIKTLVPT